MHEPRRQQRGAFQWARVAAAVGTLALAACPGQSDNSVTSSEGFADAWWNPDSGPLVSQDFRTRAAADQTPDQTPTVQPHLVHVLYIVPSDQQEKLEYTSALQSAAEHVRMWLSEQVGDSRSITLTDPVVQVFASDKPAEWFATNSRSEESIWWFLYNVYEEAKNAGYDPTAKNHAWLIYPDAPTGCDQRNGVRQFGLGVVFTRNDLLGLVGQPPKSCEGEEQPKEPKCRWVGGLAMLFCQSLGLIKGEDTDELVADGFFKYPATYLSAEHITMLRASPFFSEQVDLPNSLPSCE